MTKNSDLPATPRDNQAPARPSEGADVIAVESAIALAFDGRPWNEQPSIWQQHFRKMARAAIAALEARAADPRAAAGDQERLAELRTLITFIFGDRQSEKQTQQILALIADQVHQRTLELQADLAQWQRLAELRAEGIDTALALLNEIAGR